jgi:hypothetical protein
MFSNYVIIYDMSEKISEITEKSNEKLIPIINTIKIKESNNISKLTRIFKSINTNFIKKDQIWIKSLRLIIIVLAVVYVKRYARWIILKY